MPSSRKVLGASPIRSWRSGSKSSAGRSSGKPPRCSSTTRPAPPLHSLTRSAATDRTQNGRSAACAATRLRVRKVSERTTRSGTERLSVQTWCSPGAAKIARPSSAYVRSISASARSSSRDTSARRSRLTAGSSSSCFLAAATALRSRTRSWALSGSRRCVGVSTDTAGYGRGRRSPARVAGLRSCSMSARYAPRVYKAYRAFGADHGSVRPVAAQPDPSPVDSGPQELPSGGREPYSRKSSTLRCTHLDDA